MVENALIARFDREVKEKAVSKAEYIAYRALLFSQAQDTQERLEALEGGCNPYPENQYPEPLQNTPHLPENSQQQFRLSFMQPHQLNPPLTSQPVPHPSVLPQHSFAPSSSSNVTVLDSLLAAMPKGTPRSSPSGSEGGDYPVVVEAQRNSSETPRLSLHGSEGGTLPMCGGSAVDVCSHPPAVGEFFCRRIRN